MGSLQDKLTYLAETKNMIKNAILNKGVSISDTTPFRTYPSLINSITTGGGGGTSEANVELYKIKEYIPHKDAYTLTTGVNVQGMGYFGDPEDPEYFYDYRDSNGVYTITDETKNEDSWRKHEYLHSSGKYKLVYQYEEDYPEECYWRFYKIGDDWPFATIYHEDDESGEEWGPLRNGTFFVGDWDSEPWEVTITITEESFPEQQYKCTGNKVINYNSTTSQFEFEGTLTEFSGNDNIPLVDYIYAVKDGVVFGSSISLNSYNFNIKNAAMFYRPNGAQVENKFYPDVTGKCKVMRPGSQTDLIGKPARTYLPVFKGSYIGHIGEGGLMIKNLKELNAFTIECWAYLDSTSIDRVGGDILMENSYAEEREWLVTSKRGSEWTVAPIYKQWYHLVIMHEENSNVTKEYINGVYNGDSEFRGMPELVWNEDEHYWESTGNFTGTIYSNDKVSLEFSPGRADNNANKLFDDVIIWDKVMYNLNGFIPPNIEYVYNIN